MENKCLFLRPAGRIPLRMRHYATMTPRTETKISPVAGPLVRVGQPVRAIAGMRASGIPKPAVRSSLSCATCRHYVHQTSHCLFRTQISNGRVFANDFDLKAVARIILASRVYQLSSESNATNQDDEQNFSHFLARRLPAEVLLDAICHVTDVPEHFPGMPIGTRATQVWDNRFPSYFLDTFGRSERKSPCECGKSDDPTMSQALHLMNAPEITAKLSAEVGRIARLIREEAAPVIIE